MNMNTEIDFDYEWAAWQNEALRTEVEGGRGTRGNPPAFISVLHIERNAARQAHGEAPKGAQQ